ncbi:hypothetical protein ES703_119636 [subsurface metagenome]
MVISIALLGFGFAGTLISLFKKWLIERANFLLPFLFLLCSILISTTGRLSRIELIKFDSYELFIDRIQFLKLAITYTIFFLPFFSGAMALGIIYVKYISGIGYYYFADLFGAGTGSILIIILFWNFSPQKIPSLIALFPVFGGLLLIDGKSKVMIVISALLAIACVLFTFFVPFGLNQSQYKSLSYSLNLPKAKIEYEKNSPYGFIQVVSSPVMRFAPGLSLSYTGDVPTIKSIYRNGDSYAALLPWNISDSSHILNYTTMTLPFLIAPFDTVLILDAKAGMEMTHAMSNGVVSITAVEPNTMITSLLKNEYARYTDSLLFRSEIEYINAEPRSFIAQEKKTYDLIIIPLLGAFGGNAGLQAIQENNLLTLEAFNKIWNSLKNDGVLSLSSWLDSPSRVPYKLAVMLAEGLENEGVNDPADHIIAIKSWGTVTYCAKKSPLETEEIIHVKEFCEKNSFDLIVPGESFISQDKRYNMDENQGFDQHVITLLGSKRNDFIRAYDFRISPATNNSLTGNLKFR